MVKTVTLPPRPGLPSYDLSSFGIIVKPSGTPTAGDGNFPSARAVGVPSDPPGGAVAGAVAAGGAGVGSVVGAGGGALVGLGATGAEVGDAGVAGAHAASSEVIPVRPSVVRNNARRL